MTRLSHYLLPTEKHAPADAEAVSHKLMVRAGLIRQMGAGMWTWLPAGWRVHQRIVQIVRDWVVARGFMSVPEHLRGSADDAASEHAPASELDAP